MGLSLLAALILFAQAGAGSGDSAPAAGLLSSPLIPLLAIGVLFYLLILRPERRKRAEMSQLLDKLKKNDRVVTVGGIYGVVVNAPKDDEYVMLRVDESSNAKLRVLRSSVSRVVGDEDHEGKKEG